MKVLGIDEKRSKTCEENIIFNNNYRISVLNKDLLRIEYSLNGFLDYPTQSIWYRDYSKVNFEYEVNGSLITIKLEDKVFTIDTNDLEQSFVVFKNGEKVLLNNDNNLKGTTRTLDMSPEGFVHYDNPLTCQREEINYLEESILDNGVCSKNGVAVYDDSQSLVIASGELKENYVIKDIYVFAHGSNYEQAVKDLYYLCGNPPLLPKYVFGNWWSRYWPYTDKEYLYLLDEFEEKQIPLSVATIDMDWHYVDIKSEFKTEELGLTDEEKYGEWHGWTGFTWNKHLFPNHQNFLDEIKKRDLKITLNLHPASGIRWFEDFYQEACEMMGVDSSTKEYIPFDFTNNDFIDTYFKMLNKLEDEGVDFWWIDWQQGNKSKIKGYDPLWGLNHFHFNDLKNRGNRPLILSRYSKFGSHRYPLGFSGDTIQEWDILKYMVYFTHTSTNIGYTFWSHDIGAHHAGYHDQELYVRWLQFALYNPVLRLHSASGELYGKEPWNYQAEAEMLVTKILQKRAKMIPFIYTLASKNSLNGDAFIRPLYYKWNTENAYKYKYEYLFGDLLVCPILEKRDATSLLATQDIYLPEGNWVDVSTNISYSGNQELKINRYLDEIPVFMNEGGIVYENKYHTNSLKNQKDLVVTISAGNGNSVIYEDDGESLDYQNNDYTTTTIDQSLEGNNLKISISTCGELKHIPNVRNYEIRLLNKKIKELSINGVVSNSYFNKNDVSIMKIENCVTSEELTVTVILEDLTSKEYMLPKIKKVLLMQNVFNDTNHELYNKFINSDITEYLSILEDSYLDEVTKDRIKEIMKGLN